MGIQIVNGRNGNTAEVDDTFRLRGRNISEPEIHHASELGYTYNVNSGSVNLTSANESMILYIKNTENYDFYIMNLIINIGVSTLGSGDVIVNMYKNPTGGTIISGALSADINQNWNTGSTNTFDSVTYKGVEGATQTGGIKFFSTIVSTPSRTAIPIDKIIIPKGRSVVVGVDAPALNTSMNVQVTARGFVAHPDVIGGVIS